MDFISKDLKTSCPTDANDVRLVDVLSNVCVETVVFRWGITLAKKLSPSA